jgi:hypothetical protein
MNNLCICWYFTLFLLGILIFKGLTARRLYKSFGVKGLMLVGSIYQLVNFNFRIPINKSENVRIAVQLRCLTSVIISNTFSNES